MTENILRIKNPTNVIFVQSTNIGIHENKATHSICFQMMFCENFKFLSTNLFSPKKNILKEF